MNYLSLFTFTRMISWIILDYPRLGKIIITRIHDYSRSQDNPECCDQRGFSTGWSNCGTGWSDCVRLRPASIPLPQPGSLGPLLVHIASPFSRCRTPGSSSLPRRDGHLARVGTFYFLLLVFFRYMDSKSAEVGMIHGQLE